jgi:hypothetical protein
VRITEKSESTDDTPPKMNYQEEDDTETDEICEEPHHPHRETRWENSREEDSVGRITTREYWTEGSPESDRSPDSFTMTRRFERVLREFFYASEIHEPDPDAWENKCHRKEDEESTCDIFPERWIHSDEHGRSLQENREDEQWEDQWSDDDVGSFPTLSCETPPEDDRKEWEDARRENRENTWEKWYEDDSDHEEKVLSNKYYVLRLE